MTVARRGFLKFLGMAPAAGAMAAEQAKISMMGVGANGMNRPLAQSGGPAAPQRVEASATFRDFASWLTEVGETELRARARHIDGFDPDIIEMKLPLNTKTMMQRERNYQRILAERQDWFSRVLKREGKVQWWS